MKLSVLEKGGLNSVNQKSSEYLLKYFIEGTDKEPPRNWSLVLEEIKKNLNWDPEGRDENSFADIASQVCFCILA